MTWQGETQEGTLDNIQEFWAGKAEGFQDAHGGMMRDHFYRMTEINLLRNMLRGRRVLDAGCGAGWATMYYAAVAKSVVGCDITGGLIDRANRMLNDHEFRRDKYWKGLTPWGAPPYIGNVIFEEQNVLDLPYAPGAFEAVTCQRLLINLPTWELQQQALENLIEVLMPGGLLLITEVTEDGHGRVNALRKVFGLDPLERYWHNNYLNHDQFMAELEEHPLNVMGPGCLDIYGFLSKVIYPAMAYPEEPQFMSGFNLAAAMVSQFYPDSSHITDLYNFMDEVFRGALSFYWPDVPWAEAYDAMVTRMDCMSIDTNAIRGCNHQAIYVAERS